VSRVGIFAGTFDPIHNGHLDVARLSKDQCLLSEVYFAVEEEPWGVKNPVGIEKRYAMVNLTIKDESDIKQIVLPQKHFDINSTLPYLETHFGNSELFFIFGADVFIKMDSSSWPNLPKLFNHNLIIFERGEINENDIQKHAEKLGINIAILTSQHLKHSSTDVRIETDKSIWVPRLVAKYITENKLYVN